MRVSSSHIYLKNIRLHAFHGVLEQERVVGNDYNIFVDIAYDFQKAMKTDRLDDTINYADVYELVKREMEIPSQLLEHVVQRIGEKLMEVYPTITEVFLKLTKLNPPFAADCYGAGVCVHLINDKTY